jgi:hypothetical protein
MAERSAKGERDLLVKSSFAVPLACVSQEMQLHHLASASASASAFVVEISSLCGRQTLEGHFLRLLFNISFQLLSRSLDQAQLCSCRSRVAKRRPAGSFITQSQRRNLTAWSRSLSKVCNALSADCKKANTAWAQAAHLKFATSVCQACRKFTNRVAHATEPKIECQCAVRMAT